MTQQLPHVLLVEDDEPTLRLLGRELRAHYDVSLASHGGEGLEIALAKLPDLVITDIQMPILDGISMVRRLQEQRRMDHVPVIFLTSNQDAVKTVAAVRSGAFRILTKPISLQLLHDEVRRALARPTRSSLPPSRRPAPPG